MQPAPGRDAILGSMRSDGSRRFVYPADVRGRWLRARRIVFAVLMLIYVFAPFVTIHGRPAVRLDVARRRFDLLGWTFNPQDLWLLLGLALAFVFGLLLVTAWRGRIWCGWACPQTVFLEGIYRPIERWLEGPAHERRRAETEPWTRGLTARKWFKWMLYLLVSLAIAHTAAAVFVGPRELLRMIEQGPIPSMVAFSLTTGFTALLLFNFSWFREQFCVVLCPYGRMQSVLHDEDSITVAYDHRRGEPRGKLRKEPSSVGRRGDCIDCHRCVAVCPTAIDIRNGLQMECLACLQCVDACDEVMARIQKPRGLIGLYSARQLEGVPRRWLRLRLALYLVLMLLSGGSVALGLMGRAPFELHVLRPRGALPFAVDGDRIRNAYELHVIYKGVERGKLELEVEGPEGAEILLGARELELESLQDIRIPVAVAVQKSQVSKVRREVRFRLRDAASGRARERTATWLAPPGF